MREIILMVILAVVSNSAVAEWVKVFFNETETIYADFTTAQKKGYTVKMSSLSDFKTTQKTRNGIAYLSLIEPGEYECKEEKMRASSFSMYNKNMGDGKMVYGESFTKEGWIPVNSGNVDHVLWKFACGSGRPL